MKEVAKPRQPHSAGGSLFSQGLIDLLMKFEARERLPIAKDYSSLASPTARIYRQGQYVPHRTLTLYLHYGC